MLDKSVPFHRVILQRNADTPIQHYSLPDGYSYSLFQSGDEEAWADIETSVHEFDKPADALSYFRQFYLPFLPELQRRTLFIVSPKQEKIATLSNWWGYTGERRDPWLHWVAVKPEFQGLGLGKAIVSEGLRRMQLIEGDRHVYLPTQTWSYRAIGIYLDAGFHFNSEIERGGFNNELDEAIPVLNKLLKKPIVIETEPVTVTHD